MLATDDAVVVGDIAGLVLVEETDQVVVLHDCRAGAADREQVVGLAVSLLDAVAEAIGGTALADALEDLRMREVAEDVAGEAETQVQTVPEARRWTQSPIVEQDRA